MKSVAIIGTRGYPSFYGGFETLVRYLVPYLVESGWTVRVYGRREDGSTPSEERVDGVEVVHTAGVDTKSLSTLSFGLTSTWDAAKWKPDVALVLNVANGFWLPLLKVRGVPSVLNVDGLEWEREKWGPIARNVFRAGARFSASCADTLVYDARAIADHWRDHYGTGGVVIPYGGTPVTGLELQDPVAPGEYALAVARFVPENTVAEFIEAAAIVAKTHDVVIVGSSGYGGALEDRVRELASSNERVHWLGHVRDDARLFALWSHAGVYFHGHSVGGTNPALVQAMACGAPTVARDTVYNREVLGPAGVFVRPEPAEIAREISLLLAEPARRSRLSNLGRLRAEQHYSWEAVCLDYGRALEALIRS